MATTVSIGGSTAAQEILLQLRGDSSHGVNGRCKFQIWLDDLPDGPLKEAVVLASADDRISKSAIVRLAVDNGFHGGLSVGRQHIGNRCACKVNK